MIYNSHCYNKLFKILSKIVALTFHLNKKKQKVSYKKYHHSISVENEEAGSEIGLAAQARGLY